MPFGQEDPGSAPPRHDPRGRRGAWLALGGAGMAAAAALLGAGKATAAACVVALGVWVALVARFTRLSRARAVTRTGDGVEIHVRRADRLLAVALGFAPMVGGALLMGADLGWEAVAAALAAFAIAIVCAVFFGGDRLRVGAAGVQRISWSGRATSISWSALERFEREAAAGEEAGDGFLLCGQGTAGGRAQPVRIRIPDSQAGMGQFASIALAHAPERVLGAQPALRQALEALAGGSTKGVVDLPRADG